MNCMNNCELISVIICIVHFSFFFFFSSFFVRIALSGIGIV